MLGLVLWCEVSAAGVGGGLDGCRGGTAHAGEALTWGSFGRDLTLEGSFSCNPPRGLRHLEPYGPWRWTATPLEAIRHHAPLARTGPPGARGPSTAPCQEERPRLRPGATRYVEEGTAWTAKGDEVDVQRRGVDVESGDVDVEGNQVVVEGGPRSHPTDTLS